MRIVTAGHETSETQYMLSLIKNAFQEFYGCELTADMQVQPFISWLHKNYGILLHEISNRKGQIDSRMVITNEQKFFLFQIKFANNE